MYHYSGNNPIRYTDPNGREICELAEAQSSVVLSARDDAISGLSNIKNQLLNLENSSTTNNSSEDFRRPLSEYFDIDSASKNDVSALIEKLDLLINDLSNMSIVDFKFDTDRELSEDGLSQTVAHVRGVRGENGETLDAEKTIYLHPRFFERSARGTNTQSGTLVHETSHKVLQTGDYVYGDARCKQYDNKQKNADNWKYFYEKNR